MPRKTLVIAFLLGWLFSMVIAPGGVFGMVRAKTSKNP